MKHILVKKFGPLLGIALCFAIILGSMLMPSACQMSPEQRAVVIPLLQTSAAIAEGAHYLPPGSSVTIGKGLAVVTSPGSNEEKLMALKDLGIAEAVKSGTLKEGDALLVDQAGTALVMITSALKKEGPSNPLLPPASP